LTIHDDDTGLTSALKYLINALDTNSSRDCEIGEITRARAAIAEAV